MSVSELRLQPALHQGHLSMPSRSRYGTTPLLRQDEPQELPWTPRYAYQTREWIEACDKLHGSSCVADPIPQRPPDDVPLWLIDTHEQCIVPGVSAHRCLALSYVWPESRCSTDSGAPPQTLLLDHARLEDFQRPGYLGSPETYELIPAVIRHAVWFTCVLNERFLWVDRVRVDMYGLRETNTDFVPTTLQLCIVQDDIGTDGTLSQVGKMDKIYNGAYLTIIAAATDEMYQAGIGLEWPTFKTAYPRRWKDIGKAPMSTQANVPS